LLILLAGLKPTISFQNCTSVKRSHLLILLAGLKLRTLGGSVHCASRSHLLILLAGLKLPKRLRHNSIVVSIAFVNPAGSSEV
jgi:hypothetical protein